MHTLLRALSLALVLTWLAGCGGEEVQQRTDSPATEKSAPDNLAPPATPPEEPQDDPRSEAMEAAIRNTRHALCPGMDLVPVSQWPYLLIIERRGSETGSEAVYQVLTKAMVRFGKILEETFPGAFRKELETPLRVVVHKEPNDPERAGMRTGKHGNKPPETVPSGGCFYPPSRIVHVHRIGRTGSKTGHEAMIADLYYWMTIQRLATERRTLDPHPWIPTPEELKRFRAEEAERLKKIRAGQVDASRTSSPLGTDSLWLDRGMAEYVRGLATPTEGRTCKRGLRRLVFFHQKKRAYSLSELTMCRDAEEADQLYRIRFGRGRQDDLGRILVTAQGWSLVHFFLHGSSGRHRKPFLDFVRKSASGNSFGYETLRECFGIAGDEGWKEIEGAWQKHVAELVASSRAGIGKTDGVQVNPAAVLGVVQKVNAELKYVMLSVGKDDKVAMGDRFIVNRNGRYVGEVQVDCVYPKACSASFVLVAAGMKFEVGDTASKRP